MVPRPRGQASDEGGEDRSVGPVQPGCPVGSAKHRNLVTQHQQLDVLG
jgi:hypothetical protein